jgi:IPT/TIG domain
MRAPALALVAAAVLAGVTAASATPAPPLLAASGTATIDGVMGPGEWTNAAKVDFAVTGSPGWNATGPGSLLVMNDAANLYVAFVIPGSTPPASDVHINFDNNDDGTLEEGDDVILLNPSIGFYDEYFTKKPPCPAEASWGCLGIFDTDVGATNDGSGQMRNNGSFTFYEMSHPLNSADDAHDFSLSAGDVIGITQYSGFRECDGHTCADTHPPGAPLHVVITPFGKPTISSVMPSHGIAEDPVQISGTHFIGATSVKFGGVSAEFEVASNGSIATAVPGGAKSGPITVTTPGGTVTSATKFVVDVAHPVIAPPTTSPKPLRAGRYATVTFEVTDSSTGGGLIDGKMVCDPSVDGKVLPHTESFAYGTASLRFRVPASAKGKVLTVHLTIRWQGTSATRTARFRVR